jgi:hypothetical protein
VEGAASVERCPPAAAGRGLIKPRSGEIFIALGGAQKNAPRCKRGRNRPPRIRTPLILDYDHFLRAGFCRASSAKPFLHGYLRLRPRLLISRRYAALLGCALFTFHLSPLCPIRVNLRPSAVRISIRVHSWSLFASIRGHFSHPSLLTSHLSLLTYKCRMDTAWISAFSAVMGSLVGAFTSFVTTYANQRAQYRRDFLSRQFAQRETLYSEFINEAARLQVDSLDHQMDQPGVLVAIYALANRIRLNASDEVVQAATKAIETIIESYRRPKMTAEQIREGAYLEVPDPVKEFGEACRKELSRLYRAAS